MMNHKRILVALSLFDGRDAAFDGRDAAFERALALARVSGAELYLLHAIPAEEPFSRNAAARLQRSNALRQRADAVGVRTRAHEQQGDPAEIIVLHADARPVDLVMLGRDRRTGWARWWRGSVAEQVLRRTTRPTLVVQSDDTGGTAQYEEVLVAVDMSPASPRLIDAALRMPGRSGQRATVIHAIDDVRGLGEAWMTPEHRGAVLGDARRQLTSLVPPGLSGRVKVRVANGPAAQAIRAHAEDVDADLIVMGRSRRFMHLGSTAIRVLRNTDRALLVVPPSPRAQALDAAPFVQRRAA